MEKQEGHREFRCFGPPGTGKTTWLSRQVQRAVEHRGPGSVLVCSFTKAAVHELNSRRLPIPEENLGTLHALAFRALGNPKICETGKGFKEFSENFHWNLDSGTREDVDDGYATCGDKEDERIFAMIQAKRGRRIPVEAWNPQEQALWRDWQSYKADSGQLDFTDLIDDSLKYTWEAPGQPQVGFFDECQDFTPLELALVRHWGSQMETFTLAGDDDQSIYAFKGVSVSGFLNPPLPPENIILLKQSYRVPGQVHRLADTFIHRISNQWRQEKEYKPRDVEGLVTYSSANYKAVSGLMKFALDQIENGKKVMWLATCGYMLVPLIKHFRANGIPFCNPYRRRRGDWNPLYNHPKKNSVARMLAAFLSADEICRDHWTGYEFKQWSGLVKGVFHKNAKDAIDKLKDDDKIVYASALHYMSRDKADGAFGDNRLQWIKDHLLAKWKVSAEYVLKIYERSFSTYFMINEPFMRLGTIHSVKGGEADVVILFPDVSPQALTNPVLIAGKDHQIEPVQHPLIRQFYVGMTRAREHLVICDPVSKFAFQI